MSRLYKAKRCRLQELLDERGWTHAELGARAGLSKQQVSNWASFNRMMSLPNAALVADTIGCSIDALYEWYKPAN